jgi:DNA polymerase III epsilon subunit-like protein
MDLEFNQHFNFGDSADQPGINPSLPFEVIQTGMVELDENFNVSSTLSILIKPQIYKRMHPFVEKLTGITKDMFDGEKSFPETYGTLIDFAGGNDNVFCVWGGTDVKLLHRNIAYYKLDGSKLTKRYIDVQHMATKRMKLPAGACVGLENAVKSLDIPTGAAFHNALNDALYTAAIFKALKNEEPTIETCCVEQPAKGKTRRGAARLFDVDKMLAEAEKMYGRELTKKEKSVLKRIYAMGRRNKFGYNKK